MAKEECKTDFGQKMKAARVAAGLSQNEVAMAFKWAQPYIAKYESPTSNPTYSTMAKIADLLGCTIEFVPKKEK